MVFREAALAFHGGHDRNLQQFGQPNQLVAGFGIEYALTGKDDGVASLQQDPCCVRDVAGIAGRAGGLHRLVGQGGLVNFRLGKVGRDFDHDRPRPAVL